MVIRLSAPIIHVEALKTSGFVMRVWFQNVRLAIVTISEGMYVTLASMVQTFRRKAFTEHFEYPEHPCRFGRAIEAFTDST